MSYDIFEPILELSESEDWNKARLEWELEGYKYFKDWTYCACGHKIKEALIIRNQLNGNEATVGNCCINQFPGQRSRYLAFKAALDCRINEALIELTYELNILTDWEHKFMLDVWRKRKFKGKQRKYYLEIKRKIFDALGVECP